MFTVKSLELINVSENIWSAHLRQLTFSADGPQHTQSTDPVRLDPRGERVEDLQWQRMYDMYVWIVAIADETKISTVDHLMCLQRWHVYGSEWAHGLWGMHTHMQTHTQYPVG